MSEEPEKLFYSISEVADDLKVNPSLLRFWEKEFPSIRPTTNKKGNRMYTKREVDLIYRIYDLVKVKGFTLQGAREQLRKKKAAVAVTEAPDLKHTLESIRNFLIDLKKEI